MGARRTHSILVYNKPHHVGTQRGKGRLVSRSPSKGVVVCGADREAPWSSPTQPAPEDSVIAAHVKEEPDDGREFLVLSNKSLCTGLTKQ